MGPGPEMLKIGACACYYNILDARTSLLPVYISLAVETDRLVYVFNDLVIGERQEMSTQ